MIKKTFDTADAMASLRPESSYVMRLNSSADDKIEWRDTEKTQPTTEELNTEKDRLQAEYDAQEYQRDRIYPELGEQLDMLFHDMTTGKGTKDGEWYKAVAKVKTDNPKPTE